MRGEGTGLYNLSRNIGSSVGISVVTALLTQNMQINHANIASLCDAVQPGLQQSGDLRRRLNPYTRGRPRRAGRRWSRCRRRSSAYINDFKLMMILSLAAMPLVFLLRKPKRTPAKVDHSAVME